MHPDPHAAPMTLAEEFHRFLLAMYPDPPSPQDANRAVREQYRQIRNAFYAGCAVAHDVAGVHAAELAEYGVMLLARAGKSRA